MARRAFVCTQARTMSSTTTIAACGLHPFNVFRYTEPPTALAYSPSRQCRIAGQQICGRKSDARGCTPQLSPMLSERLAAGEIVARRVPRQRCRPPASPSTPVPDWIEAHNGREK